MRAAESGLTGTKLGCGEGGCGACTVMVSSVADDGQLLHRSVNACLCPLYAVEGMHVITVEGAPGWSPRWTSAAPVIYNCAQLSHTCLACQPLSFSRLFKSFM